MYIDTYYKRIYIRIYINILIFAHTNTGIEIAPHLNKRLVCLASATGNDIYIYTCIYIYIYINVCEFLNSLYITYYMVLYSFQYFSTYN
jgi:hypothetical protein